MKSKLILFSFCILFLFGSKFFAQTNFLNNTLQISAMGGITLTGTDYDGLYQDFAGKLALEYYFNMKSKHTLGLRFFGLYGYTRGVDETMAVPEFKTEMQNYGAGFVYGYQFGENWVPYIFAGVSMLDFNPQYLDTDMPNNVADAYEKRVMNYNVELGLKAKLNKRMHFTLAAGLNYNTSDWLDDIENGSGKDHFGTVMIGLSYALSGSSDSDGDGVSDDDDRCPDTPKGVAVDEFGCPLDSDNDGVPDYIDQCINTSPGTIVDDYGCPLDSDGDGVIDEEDQCPDTPAGVRVDAYGCPRDLDNDGVADYLDRCPNTPPNTPVDDYGCPIVAQAEPTPPPAIVVEEPITSYNSGVERIAKGTIWTDGDSYVVQVSSWRTEKKANSQAKLLKNRGFNSYVERAKISSGTWYRVRVGYFRTLEEALEEQQKIKR